MTTQTQTCSCGRPLLKELSSSSPFTTCPHYNQSTHNHQKYILPDRPKSTSTPPPHRHFRASVTYASPRHSMDSSSSQERSYHRSNSNASSISSGSASPSAPPKSLPALSETRRSSSMDMAYSPIAAGFARLSRKEREAAALKARADRSVGLDPGRMFAGAA